MRYRSLILALAVSIAAAGCSSSSTPTPPRPANTTIFYTYFSDTNPAMATVAYPLTTSRVPTQINGNATNMLTIPNALLIDSSSRLWVFNRPNPCCLTNVVQVFSLPFTQASAPLFTLTLSGTNNVIGATFDASGNLWVTSDDNTSVFEFLGPFTATTTLTPNITLTNALNEPTALAFDGAGDLFVTNFANGTVDSIARFNAPITTGMTASAQLNGVNNAAGIAFDRSGNLYVGSGGSVAAPGPIYRFNAGNQGNAAVPDITNSTGLLNDSYASTLLFDSAGNLYDADCGNPAKIYVFPTATTAFSSSLAPSVTFADTNITAQNCVWGIAIH
jgi:sugar lactone lactonase YvrE